MYISIHTDAYDCYKIGLAPSERFTAWKTESAGRYAQGGEIRVADYSGGKGYELDSQDLRSWCDASQLLGNSEESVGLNSSTICSTALQNLDIYVTILKKTRNTYSYGSLLQPRLVSNWSKSV